MSEPTKYADFVMPELSKSRLDAQWARVSSVLVDERRPADRKRLQAMIPAVGILVAACALGLVLWPRDGRTNDDSVWEGSVVASDDAPVEMTLAEGTHIQVDPRSEVKLLHSSSRAVQVRLGHGSARFQVAKKRSRRFSVNLGRVEVVVTGTQFRVYRKNGAAGDRVQVAVEEGSVEVHREDGRIVSLQAGENWSTVIARDGSSHDAETAPVGSSQRGALGDDADASHAVESARTQNEGAPTGEPVAEEEDSEGLDEDGAEASAEDAEASVEDAEEQDEVDQDRGTSQRRAERAKRRRRARAAALAATLASGVDAAELLDHANLARRAGRLEDSAELYADLVARYPRDRRASLAAFELGRLRMDSLRDIRGAVTALERALKLDAHGTFAEDALARLVLAEEARGDRPACSRARARYLARYPEGVHAQHVAERCDGN